MKAAFFVKFINSRRRCAVNKLTAIKRRYFKDLIIFIILALSTIVFCSHAMADVVLINLSPNRGMIGSVVTITARGLDAANLSNNTVFINGVKAPVMRVFQVTNSEDLYKLLFQVPPDVVSPPNSQPISVDVNVEVNGEASNTLPFTLFPSPAITSVTPDSGLQGESLDIEISAINTRFMPFGMQVSLGSGISVNNVNVKGSSTLSASITIADDAAIGARDVTVRMGRMMLTKPRAFTVTQAQGQGTTGLTLNVNTPQNPVFSKTVNISGSVNSGASGGSSTPAPAPAFINSMVPSEGVQGEEMKIALEGMNTHFSQGVTQLSFGSGIEVEELTVLSPTKVEAKIKIGDNAKIGPYRVMAITDDEEATAIIGFNVRPGSMVIRGKVTDEQGNPIAGALVSIKGLNLKVTTDNDGEFIINGAASGSQKLVVNAQNFAPVEINIDGKNGDTLDLTSTGIPLERRAAPPSDPGSVSIYSVLSQGANSLLPPPGIEEAKQRIINTIIAVGDKDLGIIDEHGQQLNPNITGDGIASLTPEGLDHMAKQWAIEGRTYSLVSALIFFNSIVGWDPEPPDFLNWIVALNKALAEMWQHPSEPGNSLFVAVFNRGSVVSDNPPKLTLETTLNPLQMYLLVNSFVAYLDRKFYPSSTASSNTKPLLAELNPELRATMADTEPPILLADGSSNNGGSNEKSTSGSEDAWNTVFDNMRQTVIGQIENSAIEKLFDIYTSIPDADTARAYLAIEGLEEALGPWSMAGDFITGTLSGMAGSVLQDLYKPLINKMKETILEILEPTAPEIVAAIPVKTFSGMNTILIFKPAHGDHGQKTVPKFYYAIYRVDDNHHCQRLVIKPSSEFLRTKDGYLVFVDDSPSIGIVTYYMQSFIRRVNSVPANAGLDWWQHSNFWLYATSGLPAGGYVLNLLQDTLGVADKIYRGMMFQWSGFSSIMVEIYPVTNPYRTLDIAVDRIHGKEYVGVRDTGLIYVNTPDGWEPLLTTGFAEPYQKGLAIDSQGWLYAENAASEERFGGSIWEYCYPYNIEPTEGNISHGQRYYLGRVRYMSNILFNFMTKPCDISDLYAGHFSKFLSGSIDPESIALTDVASQSVKVLDRRKGVPPDSYYGNIAQTIFHSDDQIITPFSRIAQDPLDEGRAYYLTSYDNIYCFESWRSNDPWKLFGEIGNPFTMLSDLVFDDLGDLYLLDNETGKLFLIPRQALEIARFYSTAVANDEVIELPYTFHHPSSIEISADGNSLLVGDEDGIHRIPRFVPSKTDVDGRILISVAGGVVAAPRYGDYALLPPYTTKIIIDPPHGPQRIINLCSLDSIDYEPLPEVTEDMLNNPESEEQHTQDTFEFHIAVPADASGKLLVRNIKIPCDRLVQKGQQVTLPDASITDQLVIPQGRKICPLILFAPLEVKDSDSSVNIRGIVRDADISTINARTDSSADLQNLDVTNHTFSVNIPAHSQTNVFWIGFQRQGQLPFVKQVIIRSSSAPKVTISGIVVDSLSNLPVREARIYIPEINNEVYTDCSGFYSVTVPAGQDVTFQVTQ